MSSFRYFSWMLLLVWLPPCQAGGVSDNQVKSAYVLNFAKFVEWPDGMAWDDDKATLCVVGRNVLGGALLELDGRKAGGRELRVVQHENANGNLAGCQLVFIGESERQRVAAIVAALAESSALTISDIEDFAEKGGCIGLSYRKNKIVFEVNLSASKKSRLRFPSQLLSLASNVFGK